MRSTVLPDDGGVNAHGTTPLGSIPLLLDVNVDYAPTRWGPWGLGIEWRRVSSRSATPEDLPAYSMLSITRRYKVSVFGHHCVASLDAQDVNDATDLQLTTSGMVLAEQGRRYTLTFVADF